MSIFIQEVLGLLNRNQKKITLDKTKDYFEFGKLYQTSSLNNKSGYAPKMDPFVIKWGDFIGQATEDLTRTLPGQGNLGYIPVYTDPSGSCSWDTLKDSIITQNTLNTTINIAGNLVVSGTVKLDGTIQDDAPDKVLVIDGSNIVRWRAASTISGGGTVTADNGLTMSTATNVRLGGTLTQATIIYTGSVVGNTFDIRSGTSGGSFTRLYIDPSPSGYTQISSNDNINFIKVNNTNIEIGAGKVYMYNLDPDTANHILYYDSTTSKVTHGTAPQPPKIFVAKISQSGVLAPTMLTVYDSFGGTIIWTWDYISIGVYRLTASQPIFISNTTAYYIITDAKSYPGGTVKPYVAMIRRYSDTEVYVNSWDLQSSGGYDDGQLDRATLKIEFY